MLGGHAILGLVPDGHGLRRNVLLEHAVGVALVVDQPQPTALIRVGLPAVEADLVTLGDARTLGGVRVRDGTPGGGLRCVGANGKVGGQKGEGSKI